jgi:hypothetical protein
VPAAPHLQRHPHNRWPIVIKYPPSFVYHSEGRAPVLQCAQPLRKAELLVSSTRFLNCGTRIWHLVITPCHGDTFSEYDLIKLIHLYDGRTECTGLNDSICFRLDDGGTEEYTAAELPHKLKLLKDENKAELKCGTLQLLIGDHAQAGAANPYVDVFTTLRRARKTDGADARSKLKAWMSQDCTERRIILAYCGIVTGIFDFDKIDDEEALDTLEPTFANSSAFLRIHRRTLISIAADDRGMRELWDSVGMSPYLILPHAALLYNETLVDSAERTLDSALSNHQAKLGTLDAAYLDADTHLNTLHLPNVFNYVTERSLFDVGVKLRGSNAKRHAVLAKLNQLKDHIDIIRERDRNRGQLIIQVMLGVISLLEIKGVIADMFGFQAQSPSVWLVLGLGILLLIVVVWKSFHMGFRKSNVCGVPPIRREARR